MRRVNKFSARKTTVDGVTFDSAAEARRYSDLKLLQSSGEITHLELQPEFVCTVNGRRVCKYRADFSYMGKNGIVYEDVKGFPTPVYRLKKRLVEALNPGVRVTEYPPKKRRLNK